MKMKLSEYPDKQQTDQWSDDVGRTYTNFISNGINDLIKEQKYTEELANRSKSLLSHSVGYASHISDINMRKV